MTPEKPRLVYQDGYWQIANWTECLETTTLNSIERWWVHQALAWIVKMKVQLKKQQAI